MDEDVKKVLETPAQEPERQDPPTRKPVVVTKRAALSLLLVAFMLVFGAVSALVDLFRGGSREEGLRESARELGGMVREDLFPGAGLADSLSAADTLLVPQVAEEGEEGESK